MLQATAAVMRGRRRVSFFRPRTVGPCRPALPPSFPSSKNPPQSSLHGPDALHAGAAAGVVRESKATIISTSITVCGWIDIMMMYYRFRRRRIGKNGPIILIIPRSMGLRVDYTTH